MPAKLLYTNSLTNHHFLHPCSGHAGFCRGGKAKMRTYQEKRYSRAAEAICHYKSGGLHLLQKVVGKTAWHKLKSVELQAARLVESSKRESLSNASSQLARWRNSHGRNSPATATRPRRRARRVESYLDRLPPEFGRLGEYRRRSGPLFFSRWRFECLVRNSPDRDRHRGSAEPRNPPGKTAAVRYLGTNFEPDTGAARAIFSLTCSIKSVFAIISWPAENRMFTDVLGRH